MEFPGRNHPGKGEEKALSQVPLVAGGWGGRGVICWQRKRVFSSCLSQRKEGLKNGDGEHPGTEPYAAGSPQPLARPLCPKKTPVNSGFKNNRMQQITSTGWMHETSAQGWCTGKTQRDGVEREVGVGIGMGNTCKSMADSCKCMAKNTTIL